MSDRLWTAEGCQLTEADYPCAPAPAPTPLTHSQASTPSITEQTGPEQQTSAASPSCQLPYYSYKYGCMHRKTQETTAELQLDVTHRHCLLSVFTKKTAPCRRTRTKLVPLSSGSTGISKFQFMSNEISASVCWV